MPSDVLYIVLIHFYAILFPYDIDFEIFCYFVNYLKYPENIQLIDYSLDITAWGSNTSQKMISKVTKGAESLIMLYIYPIQMMNLTVYILPTPIILLINILLTVLSIK
jgi:hypothetical protein